jgi:small GTP-binding protein
MRADALERQFRILMVGEAGTGKTCLLLRFADDIFEPDFLSTIGVDFKCKEIVLDGEKITLQIWDSAGQERFRNITNSYYRKADGIIVVYDVTSTDSFANVTSWIAEAHRRAPCVPVILVGNKCDLADKRQVSTEAGEKLGQSQRIIFLETSAKVNINVYSAFEELARELIEADNAKPKTETTPNILLRPMPPKREKKCCR